MFLFLWFNCFNTTNVKGYIRFSRWATGILGQKMNAIIKNGRGQPSVVLWDMEGTLHIAERCGGNTQGSDTSGSGTDPLNNFIERFCSLQLTGHTTPQHFSLQQPRNASIIRMFNWLKMCQSTLRSCYNVRQGPGSKLSEAGSTLTPQTTIATIHSELVTWESEFIQSIWPVRRKPASLKSLSGLCSPYSDQKWTSSE